MWLQESHDKHVTQSSGGGGGMHSTTTVCGSLVPTLHIKNESVPVRTEVGTYCTYICMYLC